MITDLANDYLPPPADRPDLEPYDDTAERHAFDLRRGDPAAVLADAERRAGARAAEIHTAWLANGTHDQLARLAGALVVIGRANGAPVKRTDLLTDAESGHTATIVRAVVLRSEALGRGTERERRRALRALAEAASSFDPLT